MVKVSQKGGCDFGRGVAESEKGWVRRCVPERKGCLSSREFHICGERIRDTDRTERGQWFERKGKVTGSYDPLDY